MKLKIFIFQSQIKNVQIDFWEVKIKIKYSTHSLLKFGFKTWRKQRRSEDSVF